MWGVASSTPTLVAIRLFGSWEPVCEILEQPYRSRNVLPAAPRISPDERVLSALRELQQQCGGIVTAHYLQKHPLDFGGKERCYASYDTVIKRLGSWQRVCELLG